MARVPTVTLPVSALRFSTSASPSTAIIVRGSAVASAWLPSAYSSSTCTMPSVATPAHTLGSPRGVSTGRDSSTRALSGSSSVTFTGVLPEASGAVQFGSSSETFTSTRPLEKATAPSAPSAPTVGTSGPGGSMVIATSRMSRCSRSSRRPSEYSTLALNTASSPSTSSSAARVTFTRKPPSPPLPPPATSSVAASSAVRYSTLTCSTSTAASETTTVVAATGVAPKSSCTTATPTRCPSTNKRLSGPADRRAAVVLLMLINCATRCVTSTTTLLALPPTVGSRAMVAATLTGLAWNTVAAAAVPLHDGGRATAFKTSSSSRTSRSCAYNTSTSYVLLLAAPAPATEKVTVSASVSVCAEPSESTVQSLLAVPSRAGATEQDASSGRAARMLPDCVSTERPTPTVVGPAPSDCSLKTVACSVANTATVASSSRYTAPAALPTRPARVS